ncbi:SdiA-regulated domain-containing protein [Mucilaginibacter koreensis]
MKITHIVLLLTACTLQWACVKGQKEVSYISPPGYDLGKPKKFLMGDDLLEISGFVFNHGNTDTVYAEQDEDGRIYRFKLGEKSVKDTRFAKHGDYEDIAILNRQVFVLKSNGAIYNFPLDSVVHERLENVREFKHLLPEGEYEGMYGDSVTQKLYVLCKNCSTDKTSKSNSGYMLKLGTDGTLQPAGNFEIKVKQIDKLANEEDKIKFRPSALARHPLNEQWYILSSVNNLLVVADKNWKVTDVYHLNPQVFLQPEGMAFDKIGNLYISNEGDEISSGNLLMFPLSKK